MTSKLDKVSVLKENPSLKFLLWNLSLSFVSTMTRFSVIFITYDFAHSGFRGLGMTSYKTLCRDI
jgi:hypothetical protein